MRLLIGGLLTHALAYGVQVFPEPLEPSSLFIDAVADATPGWEGTQAKLDSHVEVADYPDLTPRPLKALYKFRSTIALPEEALGKLPWQSTQYNLNLASYM